MTEDLIVALNTCIETCMDAERGYATAAADVRDVELKALFLGYSKERADFVMALQAAVKKLGAYPENQGSATGALHHGWVNVRKLVEGRNDRAITEECERGEAHALDRYHAALKHASLDSTPPDIRVMLLEQLEAIESALDLLKRRFA